ADTIDLIPILQKIVAINPAIKIMATPWSPPIWMKDNLNSIGGSLLSKYYHVYANYFVKYLQQMKLKGISIDAITIQNEPQHGGNNPSMLMSANQQADFIKNHLGPLFEKNGIKTKIVIWDHNCDNPNYPISILNDLAAKKYIDGSAFHLYNGDISALSTVYNAHPDKSLYFTEQWTGKNGTFDGDLKWHIKNVIIGSMRNHSKNALEWNLANDPSFGPRTPGGCTECKGALTIAGSTVSKNVAFYIIAHASKFIPSGSIRIGSGIVGNLFSAAFLTPDGKKVVIVLNNGNQVEQFNLRINKRWLSSSLMGGAVATFVI
ncbi:MAG: glycoside hydrolase family 30 beta sandwich domain-containing protein, partial [Sediminibacterium sp.]|nr:glycoside hydrolase family 30 beta sandwich domain-containing protein [Sediminibacterium sp.]